MVRYTKKELNYILQQIFKLLNDLRNIHKQNEEYRNYLITVVRQHKKQMKYILVNSKEINKNKNINNITSNIMYYLCGIDYLKDYDKKELEEIVSKGNNYSLYMKIIDNINIM